MDERTFNPFLVEDKEKDDDKQMGTAYHDEGRCHADVLAQPEGESQRDEQQHGHDEQEEHDSQGGGRQQAHHLVYHVQLDVLRLKPEIVFEHLYELPDVLNVLVARQHGFMLLLLRPGCRLPSRPLPCG